MNSKKRFVTGKTVPAPASARGLRRAVAAARPVVAEALENRQFLSSTLSPLVVDVSNGAGGPAAVTPVGGASIRLSRGALVANAVRGSTSLAAKLVVTNTGSAPLSVTGLAISGTDAGTFSVSDAGGLPGVLNAGASATVSVVYKPVSGTTLGIHTATLSVGSSDSAAPSIAVALRGLATAGTGGQLEPSLQRVLDLYQLGVATGDKNAADTNLFAPGAALGANDEVLAPKLVKAGPGAVTIQPLASFAAGTPVSQVGWYAASDSSSKTQVLSVNTAEGQTVNVTPAGSTQFDPGSTVFGLYASFPIFTNTAYSEDSLNVDEQTVANRRKVRFYPLKNADGSVVPNALVFTTEDFNNDKTGGYDTQDFIGIIRNVSIAPVTGGGLTVTPQDGVTGNGDVLSMSRISIQPPRMLLNTTTMEMYQPPNNVVHDSSSVVITNNRAGPLVITALALSDRTNFKITAGPAAGTVLQPGESRTITIQYVATKAPTTTVNETIDVGGAAKAFNGTHFGSLVVMTSDPSANRTISLRGYFQLKNEDDQEPNFETIVNKIYGFGTQILNPGQVIAGGGKSAAVGEEILSGYWLKADADRAVSVRQLVAYHTQGNTATFNWFDKATKQLRGVIVEEGTEGQSLLPRNTNGTAGAATFNPTGQFGFKIDTEWSDDTLNKQEQTGGGFGHHVRVFPARDSKGNLIPNAYIVGMDYLSINFDYQDNIYLVTNIKAANGQTPAQSTAPVLSNIMLVDAATDADLGVFTDNTQIDLSGGKQYTVEANPGTGNLGSVVFKIDGVTVRTETTPPYTIAGDTGTDHNPWSVPAGTHTLTVTPFSGAGGTGIAGPTITATFTASGTTEPDPTFGVSSLTLVNAASNQDVSTLADGATIDFSGGKTFSVRANVSGTATKSVAFTLDGAVIRTEGSAPYTINGDNNPVAGTNQTDYLPWTVSNGSHVLTVQGFSGTGGTGTPGTLVTVNLTVAGVGAAAGAGTFTGNNISAASGSTTAGSGSAAWTVKGSGTGIAAASDQFHFANQTRTGNFDVSVKLNSLTSGGTAGLVARGALSGGNSAVGLLFKGGNLTFGSRAAFGAAYTSSAAGTGTAGSLFLRLQRVGSVFTAFTGTDGSTWTQVGQATVSSFPEAILFGFGVFSGSTSQATAGFTNAQG